LVNKAVIDRFQIYFFSPAITEEQIAGFSSNPNIASKLAVEMSTYLSFRKDERVAKLFSGLIIRPNLQLDKKGRVDLVEESLVFNQHDNALLESLEILKAI